jgi:hypothetical protein
MLQVQHIFFRPLRVLLFVLVVAVLFLSIWTRTPALAIGAAVYALFYVALFAIAVFAGIRSLNRIFPSGSVMSAQLDEQTLTIATATTNNETPYSSFSKVVRHGGVVQLHFRSSRVLTATYPAALFPANDLIRLADRIANVPHANRLSAHFVPAKQFELTYATEDRYAQRLANALFFWNFGRPLSIAIFGVMVLVGFALIVGSSMALASSEPSNTPLAAALQFDLTLGVAFCLVIPAALILGRINLGRRLRRIIPVGSTYGITLGESMITLKLPANSVDVEYQRFRRVVRRGSFVVLVPKPGMTRVFLPAELFSADDLARMTSRIEGI